MEGDQKERGSNIEVLSDWRERREAGPGEAETFLAELNLPQHEVSISAHEDLADLYHIVNEVDALEKNHNKAVAAALQITDVTEREEAMRELNQARYKLRHLGYLREAAGARIFQLELKGYELAA